MWTGSENADTPLTNAGVKNAWCYRPTSNLLMSFRHRCLQTHWASADSGSKSVNKQSCTHRGPPLRVTSKYDQAKETYADTAMGRARCVPLCSTVPQAQQCNENVKAVSATQCCLAGSATLLSQLVSRRYRTLQSVPICSVIPIQRCHVCSITLLTQQVIVVLPAVSYHYFSSAVLFFCPASKKVRCCPVCSVVLSCQQCGVVLCVVLYCQVNSAVLPAHSTASLAQGFQYCPVCYTILDKLFSDFLSAVTSFPLNTPDKSTFHHTAHCAKAKTRLYT